MKSYNYIPKAAKIIKKSELAEGTFAFTLKPEGPKPFNFIPGQFVMLSVTGFGEVPIGISSSPSERGTIEVAVRNTGLVTEKIINLEPGNTIGIAGPFGNGLPTGKLKGRDIVLVAGGLGLPPLRSFIKYFSENKKHFGMLTILIGAKSPKALLYRDEYPEWEKFASVFLTTDQGDPEWKDNVGPITKLFDKIKAKHGSVMLVCGPPPMYKAVVDRFAGKSVADSDLYLFLERKMHCGIGKCQHCTCGEKYVCLNGPVFAYAELKYNEEAFK